MKDKDKVGIKWDWTGHSYNYDANITPSTWSTGNGEELCP